MRSQNIREIFLDYFARNDHKIVKSSSLLPKNDPTLLFTNAGMNQFKNVFLGMEDRSYKRATSVQKCMRVSGKHNDLEQVGRTNKHHTFFEMLGNFSFGDYFKEEAIAFGWEFVTEVIKLDKNKLYITIYEKDDEAFKIWNEGIGIPDARIFRYGKKDNFWSMGETGPCGPCSEIHYDLDPELEKGEPFDLIESGSDRFMELWNLVFMQFLQEENGKQTPLPKPSIDTGMGLERLATILQNKKSNFDSDLFVPLIEAVCELTRKNYHTDKETDTALRIIADHIRSITFLIGDGIMPANDGRGYVLKRLIRRAYRFGSNLGLEDPFLYRLIGVVCDIMKDSYPELLASAEYISKICLSEEQRFVSTLSSGLKTFHQYISEAKKENLITLPGSSVFKLYDTFGFPVELSRELAEENGMEVDEQGFKEELEHQRNKARKAWKGDSGQARLKVYEKIKDRTVQFVGYEKDSIAEAKVTALISGEKMVAELKEGDTGEIFLDKTPFYAEAGGQVGDTGILKNPHFSAIVRSVFYPVPDIIAHSVKILSGTLHTNDLLEASIDRPRRIAISRNHTATHLLHATLRETLGEHVKQAGSLVASDRMRFDFTHFTALSGEEIAHIESLVNEKIRDNISLEIAVMSLEEGLSLGAMAIFEEKYGETVRMVSIPGFSRELCGGIHVPSTGDIGVFRIISESSIAAGMRRIEAQTGESAVRTIREDENLLAEIQGVLNSSKNTLLEQIEKLRESLKEQEKENKSLRQKLASSRVQNQNAVIKNIGGIKVLIQKVEGVNNDELRNLSDNLKQKIGSGVVVLGTTQNDRAFLTVSLTKDIMDRINAVDVIKKIAPLINGGGGGRPDFAQAGGSNPGNLDQTLKDSFSFISSLLKNE